MMGRAAKLNLHFLVAVGDWEDSWVWMNVNSLDSTADEGKSFYFKNSNWNLKINSAGCRKVGWEFIMLWNFVRDSFVTCNWVSWEKFGEFVLKVEIESKWSGECRLLKVVCNFKIAILKNEIGRLNNVMSRIILNYIK